MSVPGEERCSWANERPAKRNKSSNEVRKDRTRGDKSALRLSTPPRISELVEVSLVSGEIQGGGFWGGKLGWGARKKPENAGLVE